MHKDLPPPEVKNFPAGHMLFKEDGKNALVVWNGLPYRDNGKALPNDLNYLKKNEYCLTEEALRALVPPKEKAKTKGCTDCGTELPLAASFCMTCGAAQRVWTPGMEGVGSAIHDFIRNAPDPLAALMATSNPLTPRPESPRHDSRPENLGPTQDDALGALKERWSDAVAASLQFAPVAGAPAAAPQPFSVKPFGAPIPMPAVTT